MSVIPLEVQIGTLRRKLLLNTDVEKKFLQFAESCHKIFLENKDTKEKFIDLQRENEKLRLECNTKKMQLDNARFMVDDEKKRRVKAEQERNDLMQVKELVMGLLNQGKLNDESKEIQSMLSSTFNDQTSVTGKRLQQIMSPLSIINEDSNGTIYSLSDCDLTEGDDLEVSKTRSGRSYRRSSSKKRKSSSSPNKRRSKKKSFDNLNSSNKGLRKMALKDITNQSNQDMRSPPNNNNINIMTPTAPPLSADVLEPKSMNHYSSYKFFDSPRNALYKQPPIKIFVNTPGGSIYGSPTNSSQTYSPSRKNSRMHNFTSKTIYWNETCGPCRRGIKFGKTALKCIDCKSTCHSECQESVPLPCIPYIATGSGNKMQTIADFAPKVAPMVPAIVVHCTNEIENRGFDEVGIYRVPGSEREVKQLKDQFLRGKGAPLISKHDIHVICGTVKDFLRSLKESLITYTSWADFVKAAHSDEDGQALLFQAISDLPQPNRDTLAWVISHLQRVAEATECKMPASNLAKVFGPTLVGYSSPEPSRANILDETKKQQMVMEKLLEISADYWRNFTCIQDTSALSQFGGTPIKTPRRMSILSHTPLFNRNYETPGKVKPRRY